MSVFDHKYYQVADLTFEIKWADQNVEPTR